MDADRKLVTEIKARNERMTNLEYLSDVLGPRLTGSKNYRNSNLWLEEKFRQYGIANVSQEPWTLARSWMRGSASARIMAPAEHPISIVSYGWVVGTNGTVRGPVVYVDITKPEDLERFKGKLKGAIVIMFAPRELEAPPHPALVPFGDDVLPMNQAKPARSFRFFAPLYHFLTEQGAAALLMAPDKKFGLLDMFPLAFMSSLEVNASNITGETCGIAPTPAAYISWEDYNLIWRLLQRGTVEIELNIRNSYSDKPVEVFNTIAEIKGSQHPEEVVILGAHLDSWDLGTGALDNGTGVVAVLEAARALVSIGVKPNRTIRFVPFGGEEEFLLGSKAYVKSHPAELSNISGVLVHDSGTGRVLSIALEGNYAAREVMDHVTGPMHDLGLLEVSLRSIPSSDHLSFDKAGVPAFSTMQEVLDYNRTHHSQADTFDRAQASGLEQGAAVLAIWAYNVAQLPDLLPRKPVESTSK